MCDKSTPLAGNERVYGNLTRALKQYQRRSVPDLLRPVIAFQGDLPILKPSGRSPDTPFPIASCTKPVTAALVMDEVQRGN